MLLVLRVSIIIYLCLKSELAQKYFLEYWTTMEHKREDLATKYSKLTLCKMLELNTQPILVAMWIAIEFSIEST